MGRPQDHPGFNKLLREWNQKLFDSGFKDIEKPMKNGQLTLVQRHKRSDSSLSHPVVTQAKARYFDIIGEKMLESTFDDEQEKHILTLYFEGFSQKEIKEKFSLSRKTVYRRITKWLKKWGLK